MSSVAGTGAALRHRPAWWPALPGLLVVGVFSLGTRPAAPPESPVTLRHQIAPGAIAIYDVRIETLRRRPGRPDSPEDRQVQTGKLTRVIFSDPTPGQATCAQMLELNAGAQVSPALETQPASTAAAEPVARESPRVQFSVAPADSGHAPLISPGWSARDRALVGAVVRVTDVPGRPVSLGDTWERPFQEGPIAGRHRYKVEKIESADRDQHVTLTVTAAPAAATAPAGTGLLSAESRVIWSVRHREVLSLTGRVTYRESLQAAGREAETQITFLHVARLRLSVGKQSFERQAVIEIGEAIAAYHRQDYRDASQRVRRFLEVRRTSLWRPMAEYLSRRIEQEQAARRPLPSDQLQPALVALLAAWEQAEANDDRGARQQARRSLARIAEVNRPEIARLLDDPDGSHRALGCFALAFGKAPADVALIQKVCGDPDRRARRMALTALTIRAAPLADAGILIDALRDDDPAVRHQAAAALGACTRLDSPKLPEARAALVERLKDESPAVVLAAAGALMRIGSTAQIDQVRQLADTELPEPLKQALQQLVAAHAPASRPP